MFINPNVQSIFNQFLPLYQQTHRLTSSQQYVCYQLTRCRTPAMGGQYVTCNACDFTQIRYHSCRNRHCPKCQQRATQQWSERQNKSLLPENYHHLVFTLPHELNDWVKQSPALIYRLLYQSVWQTIKQFGADKKRLNGQVGMTAILHTWGQNLSRHVHLHCLVPGGALSQNNQTWHSAKSHYLFPVRALSRCFRGKMVSALRLAYEENPEESISLSSKDIDRLMNELMSKDWVVYSKPTLQKTKTVIRYLARYTYKIAISNTRIVHVNDSSVVFQWQDYRHQQQKTMTLSGDEFIRRYLLHVLPKGFMRIRHFGFLANRCRVTKISIIKQRLQAASKVEPVLENKGIQMMATSQTPCHCPKCHQGILLARFEITSTRKRQEMISHS